MIWKKNRIWTEQESELDMEEILELADWESRTAVITAVGSLMDKADNVQEQMGNMSRKRVVLREDQ